jgi:RNA-directed DNA polymerase
MPSYYDRLCNPTLLYEAWKRLNKSNKFSHGFDNETIQGFRANLEENIARITDGLRKKNYRFAPLRAKPIPKEGGGTRWLRIPAVRDRVVLTALNILIAPRFRRFDLECSHGYVRSRSRATAVAAIQRYAAAGLDWVLEADIRKFFDTVPQPVLIEKFIKQVRIPSIVHVVKQAISTEVGNRSEFGPDNGAFLMSDSGIPQGGVLSPMLANFYLYPFDKAMEDNHFKLVRYADDFVVMCPSYENAKEAYDLSVRILEGKLGLSIHHLADPGSKTRIIRFSQGFTFLGIEFRGNKVYPAQKAIQRFEERIAAILSTGGNGTLLDTLSELKHTIDGWGNAYVPFHTTEIFQRLDEYIRVRLTDYFRARGFLASRYMLGRKELRFIGVPSLAQIKQYKPG